jgi:hypothetical protein
MPLVGKNLSLAIREEFEAGKDSFVRSLHIWVRDPNISPPKHLSLKGAIRENEPPNTLVHFKLYNSNEPTKKSESIGTESVGSILSNYILKVLPPNTSPSNIKLKNFNDGDDESVPFTISFNSKYKDTDSINNFEIRTSSWLDYEKTPSFSLCLSSEKEPNSISHSLLNLTVDVLNVNDNLPVFKSSDAVWRFPLNARRYMVIGKAIAHDADGDEIIYEFSGGKKVAGSGCCVIVPKTGEIMLVEPPFIPTHISVVARYHILNQCIF